MIVFGCPKYLSPPPTNFSGVRVHRLQPAAPSPNLHSISRPLYHPQRTPCRQIYHSARFEYLRSANNASSSTAAASNRPAHSPPPDPKNLPRRLHGPEAVNQSDKIGQSRRPRSNTKWEMRQKCNKRNRKRKVQCKRTLVCYRIR